MFSSASWSRTRRLGCTRSCGASTRRRCSPRSDCSRWRTNSAPRGAVELAWIVCERHGDMQIEQAFEDRPAKPACAASGFRTRSLQHFAAGKTYVKTREVREPYRSEIARQTRDRVEADLASVEDLVRRGATFHLTPEGSLRAATASSTIPRDVLVAGPDCGDDPADRVRPVSEQAPADAHSHPRTRRGGAGAAAPRGRAPRRRQSTARRVSVGARRVRHEVARAVRGARAVVADDALR